MAVLHALRESPGALLRNPVLIVPVLIVAAIQLPQMLLQQTAPMVAAVASLVLSLAMIVAIPFFQGGILAMATEALDGRTSLATFIEAGKAHYWQLLVGYLLLFAANVVLGGIALVALLVVGVGWLSFAPGGGAGGAGGAGGVLIIGIMLVGLAALLAYLLLTFAVQFYGHAIVLDRVSAIAGFKRSAVRVRHNLLPVVGYTVLVVILGGAVGLVFAVLSMIATPESAMLVGLPESTLPLIALVGIVITAFSAVFGAFAAVFSVGVYRRLPIPNER